MIWSRKADPAGANRSHLVGLDVTASRVRAVAAAAGRCRVLALDDPAEELTLILTLDGRTPAVGRAGVAVCRKLPHTVCANFLAQLGRPQEWRGPRLTLTPESAVAAVFEKLRATVTAEADAAGMILPGYLTGGQVKALHEIAGRAKLPLAGSAALPLAVAAHRAAGILANRPVAQPDPDTDLHATRPNWVVPMRPQPAGPASVVIVDADEFALSAAVVAVEPGFVKLVAAGAWPRASRKLWTDRLIDAVSDRCVRLCRRDPRDSGDAEQGLFEQLPGLLEAARSGRSAAVSVRSEHWYQDVPMTPADLAAGCAALARTAADGIKDVTAGANLPVPPRAVWLTDAAGRLPGLAAAVYQHAAAGTDVALLPPDAGAEAAAALLARWLSGSLPRGHLDGVIPLDPATTARVGRPSGAG